MTRHDSALAVRRQRLVRRSGQVRQQVVEQSQALTPALALADRLQDGWLWLRAHPAAVAVAVFALVVWRPRRAFSLGWRAWSTWKLVRRLRASGGAAMRWF